MKSNHNQAVTKGSRRTAATQSKIQKGRGIVRPSSVSPTIGLFVDIEKDGCADEAIDLSQAEYAALKQAAAATGTGVLMFMANAALGKASRLDQAGRSLKAAAVAPEPRLSGMSGLEATIYEAMGLLELLGDRVAKEIQDSGASNVKELAGAGMAIMSYSMSDKLKKAFDLAWAEWHKSTEVAGESEQRRAA
jgi:hypothetical protein